MKLRYKDPEGSQSRLLATSVASEAAGRASERLRFASAVAAFGMLLRESEHRGRADWPMVLELAREGRGKDAEGYRAEFLDLAERAARLASPKQAQVTR